MDKGSVVLLNGVSSSGKTTIAKALQEKLQEPYYWFSIDTFIGMAPERYYTDKLGGKVLCQIFKAFHHTIRSFVDMGMHCIVDTVFLNTPGLDCCLTDFVKQLDGSQVLIVYVHCPPEELRRREEKRGDREVGQGESQLKLLQLNDLYDVEIDTFAFTTDECVNRIVNACGVPEKYTAFAALCREL